MVNGSLFFREELFMSETTTSKILEGLEGIEIDESRFILPTEREFNMQAVDKTYVKKVKEYMEGFLAKSKDGDSNSSAFYMETPPVTTTGSYSDYGIHFIKAKVCDSSLEKELNTFDGNTIPIKLDSVECGDSANLAKIMNVTVDSWKAFTDRYGSAMPTDRFDVKLIGINAPDLPRWGRDVFDKGVEIKTVAVSDLANLGDSYIWEKSRKYAEGATLNFISIDGGKLNSSGTGGAHWHQSRGISTGGDNRIIEWLLTDGSSGDSDYANAGHARDLLLRALGKGDGYVYIALDDVFLTKKENEQLPTEFGGDIYGSGAINTMRLLADKLFDHNDYVTTGFNQFGIDKFGRSLGAAYIKCSDGQWINIAKYIIACMAQYKCAVQNVEGEKTVSDQFEIYTYDYKNRAYADAVKKLNDETDDRWRMQAALLNKKKDELRDWTVMLGDCLFMVPPTSIRCATQTTSERIPVMRSRGSMTKSSSKAERIIELDLYFYGDGINGVSPAEQQYTPAGDKADYKINGLRQLIAQFYCMPFLPIENKYINETLNVEAVALANVQVSTVPGYPKLVHVVLALQEFDYRVYMPELPAHYLDDTSYCNYFAAAINWPLARWYYQRAIIRGDIAAVDITKLNAWEQKRTCFKPMSFTSNKLGFQIVSEDHLKKLLQVKQERHKMVARGDTPLIKMSKGEQELTTNIGLIAKALDAGMADSRYLELMNSADNTSAGQENFKKAVDIVADYVQRINGSNNTDVVQSVETGCYNYKSIKVTAGTIRIGCNVSYLANTADAIARLRSSASGYVKEDEDDFFKNGYLEINFVAKYNDDGTLKYAGFNSDSMADYRFAVYCANKESVEDEIDDLQTDYPFVDYDYGKATVTNITACFSNIISHLGVSGSDGYAPQYMGAQDTVLTVELETMDQNAVAMLNMLPRISAYYVREYRQVMSFSPLKVTSELTNMLGISEVVIENVMVETVPGYPGKWHLTVRMISVDRITRRKEALMRIEGSNEGYQKDDSRTVLETKNYFDIEGVLRKAEIYPDLDLPTMSELKKSGYYFLRYVVDDKRYYPDADFYFFYAHILSSETTRQSILDSVAEDNNGQFSFDLADKAGGKITAQPNKNGADVQKRNTVAKATKEQVERAAKARKAAKEQSDKLKNGDALTLEEFIRQYSPTATWNVGDAYIISLLEPRFMKAMGKVKADDSKKQWLKNVATDMREAAVMIDKYLAETALEETVGAGKYEVGVKIIDKTVFGIACKSIISDMDKVWKKLHVNYSNSKFTSLMNSLLYASAAAATGREEYFNSDADWAPCSIAVRREISSQDKRYSQQVKVDKDTPLSDMTNISEFGCFRIKDYSQNELFGITGEWGTIGGRTRYVLDPYYRNADDDTLNAYKKNCIINEGYCAKAYFRNLLSWLAVCLDKMYLPSISYDVMRADLEKEIKSADAVDNTEFGKKNQSTIKKHLQFLKNNCEKIDAGKLFMCACLALSDGSQELHKMLGTRDYNGLNGLVQGCASTTVKTTKADPLSYSLRKLVLALIGCEQIKSHERLTGRQEGAALSDMNATLEKKYIEAAEDPMQYARDSFFDMVSTDMRGRMARAFPVMYMLFVDEGREFGCWKLHDNFYQTNAISEFQIVKNRKNPADTAHIILSNVFGTYTTEDENTLVTYDPNYWDVLESIFSPRTQFLKDEAKRRSVSPSRRAKLEPGTRIHLRMGYSANAARLPVMFNGMITEVGAGEAVEIVAQSDGIELLHQILDNDDEDSILDQDKLVGSFLRHGASPKEIMSKLLTVKGGWLKNKLAGMNLGFVSDYIYASNKNPYGIFHFGDPDFKDIFASGECTQNIYEALDRPTFKASTNSDSSAVTGAIEGTVVGAVVGGLPGAVVGMGVGAGAAVANDTTRSEKNEVVGLSEEWSSNEAPRICTDVYGKTVWDLLHICRSVSPDFLLGVAPFGFRSTLFHGAPQYYYAYDYEQTTDGGISEKRKPYQQWHIITSFSDIVKNDITASAKDVKTCAMGLYRRAESFGTESTQKVGPMWVDFDIYPEEQRTMTVDTQLFGQNTPVVGKLPYWDTLIDNLADDKGSIQAPYALAWKMTASALKESVMSMYQGTILLIGDPSIKPQDRLYISDTTEFMNGQCLVREVVHNFSLNTGFTSTITPDAIAVVDDPQELNRQSILANISKTSCLLHAGLLHAVLGYMTHSTRPLGPIIKGIMNSKTIGKIGETKTAIVKSKTLSDILAKGASAAKTVTATNVKTAKAAEVVVKGAKAGTKAVSAVLKTGGTLAVGGAAAVATLPAWVAALATYAVFATVCALAESAVERWAKNLQVLQIFPLHRNGMVLTAGVNGSMGLVVGSPTYNMPGTFKGILANISKAGENVSLTDKDGIAGLLINLLASDEFLDIGSKYRRDNGLIDDYGNPVGDEAAAIRIVNNMQSTQMYTYNSVLKHAMVPKVTNSDEMKLAINKEGIIHGNKDINLNKRIFEENYPICTHEGLKKQLDNGFFHIMHEECAVENTVSIQARVNGEIRNIRCIKDTRDDDAIYDIPMLKADARDYLAQIVQTTRDMTASWQKLDQRENDKSSFVIVKSALRVGSKVTAASTGRVFIIEGRGECKEALAKAVQQVLDANNEISSKTGNAVAKNIFLLEPMEKNGDIRITIKMNKVVDKTVSTYDANPPETVKAAAVEDNAHALLSPSSSKEWLNCTPSAMAQSNFADITGKATTEGTIAHALGAWKINKYIKGLDAQKPQTPGTNENGVDEMDDATTAYYSYIRSLYTQALARDKGTVLLTEQKLDIAAYVPEGTGTADCMIIGGGVLEIVDFKYGSEIEVDGIGNTQMRLYALGALAYGQNISSVHMAIVQPRLGGIKEGGVMTVEELKKWGEEFVKPRAQLAYKGKGDKAAGEWCKLCRAKYGCSAWKAERIY